MLQSFTEGKVVVQIVLPPSLLARINRLAIDRGINRSALIREAIELAYFHEQPVEPSRSAPLRNKSSQQVAK
jgi:metal-responsive CopG/Arc/MetJ family transcriptional regulator